MPIYTVQPGDCLSVIAERYSTDWQQVYAENRSVVGPNPNLIYPGERLDIDSAARIIQQSNVSVSGTPAPGTLLRVAQFLTASGYSSSVANQAAKDDQGNDPAANQALAKVLAAPYGWSQGPQWNALLWLWNRESGWSKTAQNPKSGALGIAQALGHGTASSGGQFGNEYPSVLANDGDAAAQIAWGLWYISQSYRSPLNAWSHEVSAGWY